jgi:phage recombination protein Bet
MISTGIATVKKGKSELAEQISFTEEQMQLMKDTVAKGVSDNEFMLFMHLAKTYGLDPFAKEIWCIKYVPQGRNPLDFPATIFTSRDGYLKIASRDEQMDGIISDAVCANDLLEKLLDGTVHHTYGNPRGEIVGAYALVFRKDRSRPAYFYAPFKEYNSTKNPTWGKYPTAMIIKVAEAMALKRAFSISGLVTQEEIGLDMVAVQDAGTSAEVVVEPTVAAPAAEPARVLVPGTMSTQEEIDDREVGGHRTRLAFAKKIEDVAQIWSEVPKHLKPQLVDDKEAAKKRFEQPAAKKQPVRDEQLMREFVEQPTATEYDWEKPAASETQRAEITALINLQTFTPKEKADMLKVLYQLDEVRANDALFKIRNERAVREGLDADKEMRQALHGFIYRNGERLGSDEVNRLTALNEDKSVHWQTLRAEVVAARENLQAVAA